MKKLVVIACCLFTQIVMAQDVSLALQKKPDTNPAQVAAQWSKVASNAQVSFANSSKRFAQELPPETKQNDTWTASAWKGEKVNTQILVWSKTNLNNVTVEISDLKNTKGDLIKKDNISTGFLQYVMTDEFRNGCGYRKPNDFDSSKVADIINVDIKSMQVQKNTTQPVWVSVKVPANTAPGIYSGTITLNANKKHSLKVALTVVDKTLPPPAEWTYRLDFWQHPFAIARVHKLEPWSDAHFAMMRKYYTMLADAGQKIVTTSIVNEPWGHQTYDDFPSLIKWTKKKDGSWTYDYSLFDKYVAFVMSCGINKQINCYSMVPWKIAFTYNDEAAGKEAVFTQAIGTPAYNEFWATMLTDFTRHLKDKGWFGITTIAMDERPMPAMQAVIKLLKTIDPNWKVSLAGDYHAEIENDIYDYCVASRWKYPEDVLQKRKQQNKLSTWYTCCAEKYPNAFTFSPPDEMVWMGWYTAATGMDGYLRWAYNSWPKSPSTDSRFTAWPAGDTYQVYPGALSSVRFEKIIEGIQDFEKIRLLRKEYQSKQQTAQLNKLEAALKTFEIKDLATETAEETVAKAKGLLNEIN
ncbi:DUF4091 domain-containing protein [Emticicia fontis]